MLQWSLTTLALIVVASGAPVVNEVQTSAIQFDKRNVMTGKDGLLNMDTVWAQVARDHNKHRQNLRNLMGNGNADDMNPGFKILPVAQYKPHAQSQKRQAEPLVDQAKDSYWTGNIGIGPSNARQRFVIDFDTGSSDLWVPSKSCTSPACANKHKYDPSASSSSLRADDTFSITYGDGSTASGPVYTDKVAIAGLTVSSQALAAVTALSPNFASEAEDGILGLAFPSLSNIAPPNANFIYNARAQRAIKTAEFAFKLAPTRSELFLGGTNPALYTGPIEEHPVAGSGFWQINDASLLAGPNTAASGIKTIIDSGTSIIYGPPASVAAFYKAHVPHAQPYGSSDSGFWTFPCASARADVAFRWGAAGRRWTLTADSFVLGRVSRTQCVGAIAGVDLGLGTDVWLLGDSFMKNVYSVFSFDKNSVGFAQLK